MATVAGTRDFNPALFLTGEDSLDANHPPDLLILNQPITSFAAFARLWKHTQYRICADGGANRLYDMFNGGLETQRAHYLPNAIHGDLDSLRGDVRAYYAAQGVDISQDHDQYSTDFGKAMQKISSSRPSSLPRDILVLGTLAGRVDQGLGLLHEMIREETRDPRLRLWLFSESNVSFILTHAQNAIRGLMSKGLFTENVGLIPVYGPATITTSGLEWDVAEWDTQMGHQVSTSNHVRADDVHVQTNAPILFTIERAPLDNDGAASQHVRAPTFVQAEV
ncbi:thiamine pyrophosphokinase-like protein 1 [Corynespora cassiicola Philippines]|uniref:Thiamine pyrophosphokinase n=1 Tax=Corynespora cassiicola Philippines TaxID=1448308 RepID=A0A2T2NYV3_CORCC|nr:thiamine pyrophosphokinase-like protein 1 [Corynespora cassiicola Philippines]